MPVNGALYEMPKAVTADQPAPLYLSKDLPAMEGLKFNYGSIEYDMKNPDYNLKVK